MAMTIATIRAGLEALKVHVTPSGKRASASQPVENIAAQILHLRWMIDEALSWPDDRREKAMRWLCFAQGVLWANGVVTIDQMKTLNAPKLEGD